MNIYIDVLIILNFYIDYVLLFICSKICAVKSKLKRLIISSFVGSISSLIILIPNCIGLLNFIYSVAVSFILSFIAFGKNNIIKNSIVLYILNCLFTGISMLSWIVFDNSNIIINNSIVYFNISPFLLIISTVFIYFIITLFKKYVIYKNSQTECSLTVEYNNASVKMRCLIDTGNILKDNLTDKPVIIINKEMAIVLLGIDISNTNELYNIKGYRIIPINSVNGGGVLNAFKPDKIIVNFSDKNIKINGLVAISNTAITNGFQAIIGAYAISIGEEITYA